MSDKCPLCRADRYPASNQYECESQVADDGTILVEGVECVSRQLAQAKARIKALEGMTAPQLAEMFHEAYERLAPTFRYKTRKGTRTTWGQLPRANKALMIAVAHEILDALRPAQEQPHE